MEEPISLGILLDASMFSQMLEQSVVYFIETYTELKLLGIRVAKIEAMLLNASGVKGLEPPCDSNESPASNNDAYDAELPAVYLDHASFQWPDAAGADASRGNFELKGLDLEIKRGELVIISVRQVAKLNINDLLTIWTFPSTPKSLQRNIQFVCRFG